MQLVPDWIRFVISAHMSQSVILITIFSYSYSSYFGYLFLLTVALADISAILQYS